MVRRFQPDGRGGWKKVEEEEEEEEECNNNITELSSSSSSSGDTREEPPEESFPVPRTISATSEGPASAPSAPVATSSSSCSNRKQPPREPLPSSKKVVITIEEGNGTHKLSHNEESSLDEDKDKVARSNPRVDAILENTAKEEDEFKYDIDEHEPYDDALVDMEEVKISHSRVDAILENTAQDNIENSDNDDDDATIGTMSTYHRIRTIPKNSQQEEEELRWQQSQRASQGYLSLLQRANKNSHADDGSLVSFRSYRSCNIKRQSKNNSKWTRGLKLSDTHQEESGDDNASTRARKMDYWSMQRALGLTQEQEAEQRAQRMQLLDEEENASASNIMPMAWDEASQASAQYAAVYTRNPFFVCSPQSTSTTNNTMTTANCANANYAFDLQQKAQYLARAIRQARERHQSTSMEATTNQELHNQVFQEQAHMEEESDDGILEDSSFDLPSPLKCTPMLPSACGATDVALLRPVPIEQTTKEAQVEDAVTVDQTMQEEMPSSSSTTAMVAPPSMWCGAFSLFGTSSSPMEDTADVPVINEKTPNRTTRNRAPREVAESRPEEPITVTTAAAHEVLVFRYEDDNCPNLFRAIHTCQWVNTLEYFNTGEWSFMPLIPDFPPQFQAKCRVVCSDPNDGSVVFSRLPLHEALINSAPVRIIQQLLDFYPAALHAKDAQGNLPLHLALACHASEAVIVHLLELDPKALQVANCLGLTPMDLALYSEDPSIKGRGKILNVFDQYCLNANAALILPLTQGGEKMLSCDYDSPSCIKLYKRIEQKSWETVATFLRTGLWHAENVMDILQDCFKKGKFAAPNQVVELVTDLVQGPQLSSPELEARTIVTRQAKNGHDGWSRHALHFAIGQRAPSEVIQLLMDVYPGAVALPDSLGMLPVHLALYHDASDETIGNLLYGYPEAVNQLGGPTGQLSLVHCALAGCHAARGEMLQMFVQLRSNDHSMVVSYDNRDGQIINHDVHKADADTRVDDSTRDAAMPVA